MLSIVGVLYSHIMMQVVLGSLVCVNCQSEDPFPGAWGVFY